jgi:hypothetical protein
MGQCAGPLVDLDFNLLLKSGWARSFTTVGFKYRLLHDHSTGCLPRLPHASCQTGAQVCRPQEPHTSHAPSGCGIANTHASRRNHHRAECRPETPHKSGVRNSLRMCAAVFVRWLRLATTAAQLGPLHTKHPSDPRLSAWPGPTSLAPLRKQVRQLTLWEKRSASRRCARRRAVVQLPVRRQCQQILGKAKQCLQLCASETV